MRLLRPAAFAVLTTSACVAPPVQPPAPRPVPVIPRPVPPPAPGPANWEDRIPEPGGWTYTRTTSGSRAAFGVQNDTPLFILRCDTTTRTVTASRSAAANRMLTLRATTGSRSYSAVVDSASQVLTARIAASDPQLDALAFSRGRILVGADGLPDLILPIWPEFARVVEDCRS